MPNSLYSLKPISLQGHNADRLPRPCGSVLPRMELPTQRSRYGHHAQDEFTLDLLLVTDAPDVGTNLGDCYGWTVLDSEPDEPNERLPISFAEDSEDGTNNVAIIKAPYWAGYNEVSAPVLLDSRRHAHQFV